MANFNFFLLTIIFIVSSTSISLHTEAHTKCSNGGPDIHFPFHRKGQRQAHPRNDNPIFELLCKENTTTVHFPSYGDLVVRSISYNLKKLDLIDPKSCTHGVFLNLNLSNTPFHYYYVVKNYTYINCSAKLSPGFVEIPCLSGSGHHVYTVMPSMNLPRFCKPIKTVAIPFKYSPYLSDNSFGLGLTWGFLGDQGNEGPLDLRNENGGGLRVGHVQVRSIGVFFAFIAASAFLAIKTMYYPRKPVCQKELGNTQVDQNEKCLGEYEAFVSNEDDYVEKVSSHC